MAVFVMSRLDGGVVANAFSVRRGRDKGLGSGSVIRPRCRSLSLSLRLAAGRVGRMMCGWVVSLVWFLAGAGGVSGLAGGLLVSSSSGQAADTAEASTRLAQARRQQQ